MQKKKVLVVFGTRPEAIKMVPVIKKLMESSNNFITKVCVTAQHRHMLDQVLSFFDIQPDYDLAIMQPGQDLFDVSINILKSIKSVLYEFKPDYLLVHGDTTTSSMAALAGYYAQIKVGHVEAGLRTYDKYSPFPEEINRQLTGRIADIHFTPTAISQANLLREAVSDDQIIITGNTVIDALALAEKRLDTYNDEEIELVDKILRKDKKVILVTGHRRENFGDGFVNICKALKELAGRDDVQIIYPVHLNPNVQKPVYEYLEGLKNVHLISPLSYPAFVWLMKRCYLILTDSGGVQEEAPSLGKPVLVMRDTTERPEAVEAGTIILVGTNYEKIVKEVNLLLDNADVYNRMSSAHNPYGDGRAADRIVEFLSMDKLVADHVS